MPARVSGAVVAAVTMLIVAAVAVSAQAAPHLLPAPAAVTAQHAARVASAHGDRRHRRHEHPRIRFTPVSGYGGAFAFNHPGATVDVPAAGRLKFALGMTLEAWALPSSIRPGEAYVLAKTARRDFSPYGLALANGVPFAYVIAGQRVVTADAPRPLAAKSWAYLAATYDGTNLELYVDGVGVATTTTSGRIARSEGPLQIGGGATTKQSFVGAIGNVRIFDTARSPAQIAADGVSPTKHGPRGAHGLTVTFGRGPNQPGHTSTSHVSQYSADLTWHRPRGGARPAGYMLYRDETLVARTSGTSHRFANLVCGTAYALSVETVDRSGAISRPATATAKTAACPSHVGRTQPPPPPPTVLPPIDILAPSTSGSAVVGNKLTASPGAWSDSPTGFAYQWQDCDPSGASCSAISGATGSTYKLAAGDAGSTIDVVVTASNSAGSAQATSATTPMVTMPVQPPVDTGAPSISGQTVVGDKLTAGNGSWSNGPTDFAYQWQDCDSSGANCSNVSGATGSSYKLAAGDAGSRIDVVVTASNAAGSGSATSAKTGVVQAQPPSPPGNTVVPVISGTLQQGGTLTTTNGSWSNSPTSYSYQWQDCSGSGCSDIAGATSSSYKLVSSDVGDTVDVVVTASNAAGSGSATSAKTGVVQAQPPSPPVNTVVPVISGTAQQGGVLSASTGSWSNSPTSYSYQWEDCDSGGASCGAISGASGSSYTLTGSDVGHTLRVVVTASNVGGSTPATSAATGTVTTGSGGTPPLNTTGPYFTASTGTTSSCSNGCAVVGQTLAVNNGAWSNGPTSFSYQWERCTTTSAQPPTTGSCSAISGATGSAYTVQSADSGHSLVPVVTASNGAGASSSDEPCRNLRHG